MDTTIARAATATTLVYWTHRTVDRYAKTDRHTAQGTPFFQGDSDDQSSEMAIEWSPPSRPDRATPQFLVRRLFVLGSGGDFFHPLRRKSPCCDHGPHGAEPHGRKESKHCRFSPPCSVVRSGYAGLFCLFSSFSCVFFPLVFQASG